MPRCPPRGAARKRRTVMNRYDGLSDWLVTSAHFRAWGALHVARHRYGSRAAVYARHPPPRGLEPLRVRARCGNVNRGENARARLSCTAVREAAP
jgi:hypothetical protein